MKHIPDLLAHRELLYMLTWRDIAVRYKQSLMGVLWAILMPILIIGSSLVVRFGLAQYARVSFNRNDMLSIVVRAVTWAFFAIAVRAGTYSLVANPSLVSKVAFPKEVFPIGSVLSSLFDFSVAATGAVILLLILGDGFTVHALLAPILIVILVALTLGLVLIFSSLNLFYRDVKSVVEVVLTYAIFFTPVLYSSEMMGEHGRILHWNPVAPLLEALSDVLVLHRLPSLAWVSYSLTFALVLLLFGYWLFKQLETRFAERI